MGCSLIDVKNLNEIISALEAHSFGVDAPLHTALNESFKGLVLDLGRGTSFTTGDRQNNIAIDVTAHDGEVRGLTIHIYGEMTFRDRTDKSCLVRVWWSAEKGITHSSTKANAWNGSTWADLPEGARTRVAEAVRDRLVATMSWSPAQWQAFAAEQVAMVRASDIRRHIDSAVRDLQSARQLLDVAS